MKRIEALKTNYAGAIYGTILSMSVIAVASADGSLSAFQVGIWALATSVVFFIAHAYASLVAAGFSAPEAGSRQAVRRILRHEWPMVQGAFLPAAILLASPLLPLSDAQASFTAVSVGIALLFAAGLLIGHRQQLSTAHTLVVAGVNAGIGTLIMLLKIFVH